MPSPPDPESESGEYQLGFPNEEVSRGFWDYFVHSYFPSVSGSGIFSLKSFVDDLNGGHADQFMERLQSLISETSSETERNKEIHFQNIMSIIGKMLGFRVQTEVHSALGRCDMILKTSDYIYIFEFKLVKGTEVSATKERASTAMTKAEEAIAQIKRSGYASPYKADKREKILIGATFSAKERTLIDWVIERH